MIPVPLLRPKLQRKAPRIPRRVRRARFPANSGEPSGNPASVSNVFKERGTAEIGDVVRYLPERSLSAGRGSRGGVEGAYGEGAVCSGSFGVDDTFRDPFYDS